MARLSRAISATAGFLAVFVWLLLRRLREEREEKKRSLLSAGNTSTSKPKPNVEQREDGPPKPSAVQDDTRSTMTGFNGSWVNYDSGEVHTVRGNTCSAGSFTPLPDGKGCILDIHGEVHRGELSPDGQTITWENNDMWRREDAAGSKVDEPPLGAALLRSGVEPERVAAPVLPTAVEQTLDQGQKQQRNHGGSRFDGVWANHATGDFHSVEGTSCSAGEFTAAADGTSCNLDVHGEVQRGEISSDGRTITWENDEMWFREDPVDLQSQTPAAAPSNVTNGFDGCWTNHDTGDGHTIQDASCNTGKFTAAADGLHCSFDVDGEICRGELSADGNSIAWENDMTWFRD